MRAAAESTDRFRETPIDEGWINPRIQEKGNMFSVTKEEDLVEAIAQWPEGSPQSCRALF